MSLDIVIFIYPESPLLSNCSMLGYKEKIFVFFLHPSFNAFQVLGDVEISYIGFGDDSKKNLIFISSHNISHNMLLILTE